MTTMKNDVVHIAYASDSGYLNNVAVAIASVFLWASDRSRIVIDLLTLDVADEFWSVWIDEVSRHLPLDCKIIRHEIDGKRFAELRHWHGSRAAYARLLLPEVLDTVDWGVYADVDTLFTDDPLKLCSVFDPHSSIMGHLEYPCKNLNVQEAWFMDRNLPFDKAKYLLGG